MDFGKIKIDDEHEIYLFGTPGQSRFNFMGKVLGKGALGVIVLVDKTACGIINFFQSKYPTPSEKNKEDVKKVLLVLLEKIRESIVGG